MNKQRLITYSSVDDDFLKRAVINSLEVLSGRKRLEKIYARLLQRCENGDSLWEHIFELLDIHLDYNRDKLNTFPTTGPVTIIANHPFGVVDGLAMGYLLSKVRPDFHLVVNEVLCREPILGKYLLPIDFRSNREALTTNIHTKSKVVNILNGGGAVGIFPSGGVATSPGFFKRPEDLEWKRFILNIIRKTPTEVVPIFFHGSNSPLFQLASQISMNLRLGLLLNELNNKKGKSLKIEIGRALDRGLISKLAPQMALNYMRNETFQLAS